MEILEAPVLAGRLLEAALLSGLVGLERQFQHKPAGLRTHMLVGAGSALIMMVSIAAAAQGTGPMADPGRIAAQVVTGIGFLGAGTIIQSREGLVQGLTTAASIWVTAAIGLACGLGFHLGAVMLAALALLTLLLEFIFPPAREAKKKRKKTPS